MSELSTRALIVHLTVRKIHGAKRDKQITAEVDNAYQTRDMGRFNKDLFHKSFLAKLSNIESRARTELYKHTVPWADDDGRMLPIANYDKLNDKMLVLRSEWDAAFSEVLANFDAALVEAENRLKERFIRKEYPTKASLSRRFAFVVRYSPVPTTNDVRVSLDKDQLDALRDHIRDTEREALRESLAPSWNKLLKAVEHMADTLKQPDKIFRDSMVGNLKDLCNELPVLNLLGDAKFDKALDVVRKRLVVNPDVLRADGGKREQVAAEAAKIASAMKRFMGD